MARLVTLKMSKKIFDGLLAMDPPPPAGAQVELQVVGTDGAVPAAVVLDVGQHRGVGRRPAVGARRRRIGELAVPIDVDVAVEDRERRAGHVPERRRQRRAMRLRDVHAAVEGKNVPAIDARRRFPLIEVERSVSVWKVFLSAWFSAVPNDFDSEYEMRPDQLLANRFSSEMFKAS